MILLIFLSLNTKMVIFITPLVKNMHVSIMEHGALIYTSLVYHCTRTRLIWNNHLSIYKGIGDVN